MIGRDARNTWVLAGLRISVGALFLIFGQYKVFGTQLTLGGGFQFWINGFLTEGAAYPFMAPVLRGFVLAHATVIAFLVAYGEFAIGVSLVHAAFWQYFGAALNHLVFALCFTAFALGNAEEALSLRTYLDRRRLSIRGTGPNKESMAAGDVTNLRE